MKLLLHPFEQFRLDDRRHIDDDDLFRGLAFPRARRRLINFHWPISTVLVRILCNGPTPKVWPHLMQRADPKGLAAAGAIPIPIEPFDDLLDPQGPRGAISEQVELINEPDGLCFDGVDRASSYPTVCSAIGGSRSELVLRSSVEPHRQRRRLEDRCYGVRVRQIVTSDLAQRAATFWMAGADCSSKAALRQHQVEERWLAETDAGRLV